MTREGVERIIDAVRRGDTEAYAAGFATDAELIYPLSPEPVRGRDAIREGEQGLFDAFTDIDVEVRSLTSEGSTTVAEVVLRATNTGPIDLGEGEPLPATGVRVELPAVWVFEFGDDGAIVSERDYFDTAAFMAQLGSS